MCSHSDWQCWPAIKLDGNIPDQHNDNNNDIAVAANASTGSGMTMFQQAR
jgi:hypothetical protein